MIDNTHSDGNKHIFTESKPGSYPITLTIIDGGTQKLGLVKSVKSITGLGLYDSKSIVDAILSQPQVIKAWKTNEEVIELKKLLDGCDKCKYILTDIQHIRHLKLIELGLGTKEDLLEEIINQDLQSIFSKLDYNDLRALLENRYKFIPEEELKLLLNIEN